MKKLIFTLLLTIAWQLTQAQDASNSVNLPDSHPVVKQLQAYNARNIEDFVACYAENVEVYLFPNQLMYTGRAKLREGYESFFKNTPQLHCKLVSRMALGNQVIDREHVTGIPGRSNLQAIAIYEVKDNLITKVYFIMED
jgi:hypothetical protein